MENPLRMRCKTESAGKSGKGSSFDGETRGTQGEERKTRGLDADLRSYCARVTTLVRRRRGAYHPFLFADTDPLACPPDRLV